MDGLNPAAPISSRFLCRDRRPASISMPNRQIVGGKSHGGCLCRAGFAQFSRIRIFFARNEVGRILATDRELPLAYRYVVAVHGVVGKI